MAVVVAGGVDGVARVSAAADGVVVAGFVVRRRLIRRGGGGGGEAELSSRSLSAQLVNYNCRGSSRQHSIQGAAVAARSLAARSLGECAHGEREPDELQRELPRDVTGARPMGARPENGPANGRGGHAH